MIPSRLLPLALALASVSAAPVAAQDLGRILGNTVERAVESEVRNRVDRETRRITRCVMGDDRCIREARARGDDVEIESTIAEFRRSSFDIQHRMLKNGQLSVECSETRVWVGRDPADASKIKAVPIPQAVIDKFKG